MKYLATKNGVPDRPFGDQNWGTPSPLFFTGSWDDLSGVLGASWRRLRGVLEGSWRPLGLSWERLGGVLGRLGTSWGHLGGVLERLEDFLGCFWDDFIGIKQFF